MDFFFHPVNEEKFKKEAVNHFVRTVVFDTSTGEVVTSFTRRVQKVWEQTARTT
jgi:hypothetical protein